MGIREDHPSGHKSLLEGGVEDHWNQELFVLNKVADK